MERELMYSRSPAGIPVVHKILRKIPYTRGRYPKQRRLSAAVPCTGCPFPCIYRALKGSLAIRSGISSGKFDTDNWISRRRAQENRTGRGRDQGRFSFWDGVGFYLLIDTPTMIAIPLSYLRKAEEDSNLRHIICCKRPGTRFRQSRLRRRAPCFAGKTLE